MLNKLLSHGTARVTKSLIELIRPNRTVNRFVLFNSIVPISAAFLVVLIYLPAITNPVPFSTAWIRASSFPLLSIVAALVHVHYEGRRGTRRQARKAARRKGTLHE